MPIVKHKSFEDRVKWILSRNYGLDYIGNNIFVKKSLYRSIEKVYNRAFMEGLKGLIKKAGIEGKRSATPFRHLCYDTLSGKASHILGSVVIYIPYRIKNQKHFLHIMKHEKRKILFCLECGKNLPDSIFAIDYLSTSKALKIYGYLRRL